MKKCQFTNLLENKKVVISLLRIFKIMEMRKNKKMKEKKLK